MTKKDKLFLNEIFGNSCKFIEISFRNYPEEGLFMEIEKNQKYFRFDSSLINGYYPIGVIDIEQTQSEYVKLIKNSFPDVKNMFVFADNLSNVSKEDAAKRKWRKMGQQFYGLDIYDFNCVYIIALPSKFNFKKLDNKIFEIPNNISIVDAETYSKINNYTICINY